MKRAHPGAHLRKLSASHIVGRTRRVWVCKGCGLTHNAKPKQCHCGRLDFIAWDSAGEQKRHATLELLQMAGEISELQRQVRFKLFAPGPDSAPVAVGEYIADFTYTEKGELVVEDYKGAITDLAAWKLRHMEAQGVRVRITTANTWRGR